MAGPRWPAWLRTHALSNRITAPGGSCCVQEWVRKTKDYLAFPWVTLPCRNVQKSPEQSCLEVIESTREVQAVELQCQSSVMDHCGTFLHLSPPLCKELFIPHYKLLGDRHTKEREAKCLFLTFLLTLSSCKRDYIACFMMDVSGIVDYWVILERINFFNTSLSFAKWFFMCIF